MYEERWYGERSEKAQTPPSKCPGERSDVHRGPFGRKYGKSFTEELQLCTPDSIIIGTVFTRRNNFINFFRGLTV